MSPVDRQGGEAKHDPWANWGENRDERPVRDNRYHCHGCGHVRAFGQGELCTECKRKAREKPDVS